MTYVYAICELRSGEAAGVRGVGGRDVELRPRGAITVACSDVDASTVPVTPESVLAHERVLESLMATGTVLPARFGTTFHRTADLDAVLERNAEQLRAGLERVRDCEEWGVRVLWQRPDAARAEDQSLPSAVASGREYMLRRAGEEQRRQATEARAAHLASEVHEQLAVAAVDNSRKVLATPDLLLSAAYLVRRERTEEFHRRVRQLAEAHAELRVLGTGPWPPYHFAPALGSSEAAHA